MWLILLFIPVLLAKGDMMISSPELKPEAEPAGDQSPVKQTWGHITVREGAEMFFWIYFTKNHTHRPLILWLQGGPGAASSGIGNFLEIGLKDMHGNKREYAWTNISSVLFVDSPVGTGFSYVWNKSMLVKTDVAAAKDLVTFLKGFYKTVTDFEQSPLYIVGESYGGKIAAQFAVQLTMAIKKKEIFCNFKGVVLGDPWLSPGDNVKNYAKFLYANSLIDAEGSDEISNVANLIWNELVSGRSENATRMFFDSMEPAVTRETSGVNFFNIFENPHKEFGKGENRISIPSKYNDKSKILNLMHIKSENIISDLTKYMNGPIKALLRLPKNATWSAHNHSVFEAMELDFMKSAIDTVEKLLNETSLEVMVYNGQLDLIVPSIGTESWIREMKWPGMSSWTKTKRRPLLSKDNTTIGYYKSFKHFSFYWILKAGHLVPLDSPSTAYDMIHHFLRGYVNT